MDVKKKNQKIYTKKVNDIRIRSKCYWYENGKKSTKFFLNFEKYCANQGCLHTMTVNEKELNDSQQINNPLYNFYQPLFTKNYPNRKNVYRVFLIKYLSLNLMKIEPSNEKVLQLKVEF